MPRMVHKNHNKDIGNEGGASKDEGDGEGMKKGPWTQAEDAMLREYVMKYGEGNWNSVQKNSGLARCGKSCRLRWANHLRPNLKKGAFSKEEELIIIHLHAKLGSKWAQMAAQLPGRTDNEIKNFWNTRMKRRQRAGLPLYPPEVFLHEPNNTYYLQQKKHKQNFRSQPHSSSSLPFSTFLSSSYPQELNTLSHSSTTNTPQNIPNSSSYINSHPQFKPPNDKSGMVLPPSTVSSHGYSFNQCNSMARSPQQDLLTSSQSAAPAGSTSPTSSHASGVYGLMGASSGVTNGYYEDAQVVEAQSLSHNDKLVNEDSTIPGKKLSCDKRKNMAQEDDTMLVETTMENSGNIANKKQRTDLSSSQILTGKKLIYEDSMEELNSMDDDLFSLLNNFPSEVPVPGWYRNGERHSLGLETPQDASSSSPTGQEFAWTLGNFWSNVPNIC